MNRFKCTRCGGNQYTACSTAEGCVYCGNKELQKMETLEQEAEEKKIHITTVDRCVMCGEIVPEGQQVCWLCKHKIELEETRGEWKVFIKNCDFYTIGADTDERN